MGTLRLLAAALLATTLASAQQAEDAGESEAYRYLEVDTVQESLQNVLSRPEFSRLKARPEEEDELDEGGFAWLDRFLDWLASIVGSSEGGEAAEPRLAGRGFALLLYAMAAVILAAAIFFLAKAVLSSARERKLDEEESKRLPVGPWTAPGELAPEEYWRRAQELADRGEHKRAIRELLLGAMSTLERKGVIRFRRGLTNRDYLRAARGSSRSALDVLVRTFEHVYFGRRDATAESYAECRRELQRGFPMEAS